MSCNSIPLPEIQPVPSRREKITIESDHKPLQAIFKKSVLAAPCRLQRMLLRLQRYNLDVQYKPGPQMYIADHLSRAYLPNQEEQDEEFQVFVLEVEAFNPFVSLTVSSERLAQLQKATEQDPVLKTLKTTVLVGWPEQRSETPFQIREYWTCREEISLHNGILFKSQRIIIPKALRPEITKRRTPKNQCRQRRFQIVPGADLRLTCSPFRRKSTSS